MSKNTQLRISSGRVSAARFTCLLALDTGLGFADGKGSLEDFVAVKMTVRSSPLSGKAPVRRLRNFPSRDRALLLATGRPTTQRHPFHLFQFLVFWLQVIFIHDLMFLQVSPFLAIA